MSNPEKEENKAKDYYEYKSTDNKSDSSSSARIKGIKDKIVGKISSTTMGKSQEDNLSESARVSNNMYHYVITGQIYNNEGFR